MKTGLLSIDPRKINRARVIDLDHLAKVVSALAKDGYTQATNGCPDMKAREFRVFDFHQEMLFVEWRDE